jgi:hypothetical protein
MNIEMLQTLYKLKPLTKGCLNIEDNKSVILAMAY